MLNKSISSFRICKQNFIIRFGSKVINVQRKHVFWRKIDMFWDFFADVIKYKDVIKLFLTNLCSLHGKVKSMCAKFHTKIIIFQKLSWIGLRSIANSDWIAKLYVYKLESFGAILKKIRQNIFLYIEDVFLILMS